MNTQLEFRPRRSCLYMPGANTRALDKARSVPADTLILDLEDAVAPEAKAGARQAVLEAVARGYGNREVLIRINSLESPWGQDDLAMVVAAKPHGLLLPKVTSGEQLGQVDAALNQAGADPDMGVWAMIEMPQAVLRLDEIAAAAEGTRLCGLVMGLNDLAVETGVLVTPDRAAFQTALSMAVMAARAWGLVVIDGVFNDFRDEAGLLRECEQGRMLGFDGKSLIHPAQIEVANRTFAPDPEDLVHARAIIEAFAQAENQGKGVIQVAGKMVELLHLQQAQRLVAISEAISASA
mgnify:CR=1 FL=1